MANRCIRTARRPSRHNRTVWVGRPHRRRKYTRNIATKRKWQTVASAGRGIQAYSNQTVLVSYASRKECINILRRNANGKPLHSHGEASKHAQTGLRGSAVHTAAGNARAISRRNANDKPPHLQGKASKHTQTGLHGSAVHAVAGNACEIALKRRWQVAAFAGQNGPTDPVLNTALLRLPTKHSA